MRYLAFLLALVCMPVSGAELRLETADVAAVLYDTPCDSQIVLALLKPEARRFYQNGAVTVTTTGVTTPLCWRVSPDRQQVWVVDEDGEAAAIPIELFTPKETI